MSNKVSDKQSRIKAYVDGPWTNEPDHKDFEVDGIKCALRRGPWGSWCGYAGVPEGHALFGKEGWEPFADLSVHGGITFHRAECPPVEGPWVKDGLWWLGFDCSHCYDLSPHDASDPDRIFTNSERRYQPLEYAEQELRSLAKQLSVFKKAPTPEEEAEAKIKTINTLIQAARNAMSVRSRKETREQSALNNALVALLADYDKGDGRG